MNDEEEEEKEVDPSLVGSLDNVYTEAPGTMPGEDPFKRVPMMVPNEKPSNLMEMEKTLEAMEASIDHESSQELDSSDDMTSLDVGGMIRRPRDQQVTNVDTSDGATEHRVLNQIQRLPSNVAERAGGGVAAGIMPDLLTSGTLTTPPDIQLSSQMAPDVTTQSRSPLSSALAAPGPSPGQVGGNQRENNSGVVDLLHNTSNAALPPASRSAAQALDLTDGLLALRVGSGEGET